MTPICHTEAPPRVPGDSLRGKRPHDYGRGRVCALPGCTTILRRTHKGPVCDPCINDNAKARARATACAAPAPATTAAPAARAMKEEKVGKESLRQAVLKVFVLDPLGCFNAGDVVKSSGVSPSCAYKNLKSLVASGEIVRDSPGVYRWPTIEDAKTAPDGAAEPCEKPDKNLVAKVTPDVAPDLIPPAPAPVIPPPEQPANEAPAPDPLPPQAGPAPFAGIASIMHEFVEGRQQDAELRVLTMLDDLDDARRERVLQYAVDRWWLK